MTETQVNRFLGLIFVLILSSKIVLINSESNLSKPLFKNGNMLEIFLKRYENPWPTWHMPGFLDLLRWRFFNKDNTNLPKDSRALDQNLPVHFLSDNEIEKFCNEDTTNKTKIIWIGHATTLVNFQNTIILMDPVFSERVAPVQFAGPKRFRPVPISVERIPRVDAVIISHNHYDHLDYQSVLDLNKKNKSEQSKVNWFVGKGGAKWFSDLGIESDRIHELTWWESKKFKNLEFVFTPAQHWCRRRIADTNQALWGSWTVLSASNNRKFFFAGDTGYCTAFKEIGKKYGPMDMSFIPIGAYEPRWFMEPQHVDPEQAVQIHLDVKSKKSFAIHWATFALAYEYYMEPKQKLSEALEKFSLDKSNFTTMKHGESFEA